MDDFKTPIQVSYNEETTANTFCGGLLSLLLRLAIFVFTIQKFVTCLTRSQVSIVETANYKTFDNDSIPYKLKDSDFYIYAQVLNKDFDNDKNPYLKMKMFIYTK